MHADTRPLICIDVDGVLNPWDMELAPKSDRREAGWFQVRTPRGFAWLNRHHSTWLNAIADHPTKPELAWATTWNDDAPRYIAPALDLDIPTVITVDTGKTGRSHALTTTPVTEPRFSPKMPAIADYVGARPLVWIDDLMYVGDRKWAAHRKAGNRATLLVVPKGTIGLERDHALDVMSWLDYAHRPNHPLR
jgi:hypothetical protein